MACSAGAPDLPGSVSVPYLIGISRIEKHLFRVLVHFSNTFIESRLLGQYVTKLRPWACTIKLFTAVIYGIM
jgi:hypothetical protein